jgi:hypothetical protein
MNNEELSKTQAQVQSHQEMTEEQLDEVNAGGFFEDLGRKFIPGEICGVKPLDIGKALGQIEVR